MIELLLFILACAGYVILFMVVVTLIIMFIETIVELVPRLAQWKKNRPQVTSAWRMLRLDPVESVYYNPQTDRVRILIYRSETTLLPSRHGLQIWYYIGEL